MLMAATMLSGCPTGASDSALIAGLRGPVTAHAAALATDDVAAMRRTGRIVITKFDAGAGP
jgi:hypothetical protein